MDEQELKFKKMTEPPVEKLICSLAVPCIISMLVTSFYNMADTFFVGMLKSNAATGWKPWPKPIMAEPPAVVIRWTTPMAPITASP